VTWLRPDGREFSDADWVDGQNRTIGMLLHEGPGRRPWSIVDKTNEETVLVVLHGGDEPCLFRLPTATKSGSWAWRLSTTTEKGSAPDGPTDGVVTTGIVEVPPWSVALLEYRKR
jgi:glycogen operon protein